MRIALVTIVLVTTLTGCASAPKSRDVDTLFGFDYAFDEVWSAVIETISSEYNYPIASMEKESGLISSDWYDLTGDSNRGYCDCGGLGLNSEDSRFGRFNIFVKETSDGVTMKVNAAFEQNYSLGDTYNQRPCLTNGVLEEEIFEAVWDNLDASD